ncbi:MAG: 1-deoxy-D-xylulose-5-phosphate reductoisomerase, partial [Shimia sp.]
SLIHALVGFCDGALMSHVGPPDMRHAIGFALHHPVRRPLPVERLDLVAAGAMTFRAACETRYPALRLARAVMERRGLAGAVFNASKERALDAFLAREIGFLDMAWIVEAVLETAEAGGMLDGEVTLDTVRAADHFAREAAATRISADAHRVP